MKYFYFYAVASIYLAAAAACGDHPDTGQDPITDGVIAPVVSDRVFVDPMVEGATSASGHIAVVEIAGDTEITGTKRAALWSVGPDGASALVHGDILFEPGPGGYHGIYHDVTVVDETAFFIAYDPTAEGPGGPFYYRPLQAHRLTTGEATTLDVTFAPGGVYDIDGRAVLAWSLGQSAVWAWGAGLSDLFADATTWHWIDGLLLAVTPDAEGKLGALFLERPDGTREWLADDVGEQADIAVSPNGRYVGFTRYRRETGTIFVGRVDRTTGDVLVTTTSGPHPALWLKVATDGKLLVGRYLVDDVVECEVWAPELGVQTAMSHHANWVDGVLVVHDGQEVEVRRAEDLEHPTTMLTGQAIDWSVLGRNGDFVAYLRTEADGGAMLSAFAPSLAETPLTLGSGAPDVTGGRPWPEDLADGVVSLNADFDLMWWSPQRGLGGALRVIEGAVQERFAINPARTHVAVRTGDALVVVDGRTRKVARYPAAAEGKVWLFDHRVAWAQADGTSGYRVLHAPLP